MSDQDDFTQEFLIESYENLDRLDAELVALEEAPESKEILSSIFRTIHTIKGTCGFLEFSRLEKVTHVGENLLSSLRDGVMSMTDDVTTGLLQLVDAVRQMLAHIEEQGVESSEEYSTLIDTLIRLHDSDSGAAEERPAEFAANGATPEASEPLNGAQDSPAAESQTQSPSVKEKHTGKSSLSSNNIRVQVDQLDKLMNLAGELVLARNQIVQMAADSQDSGVVATAQGLNLITAELQEGIMKIRMQPIGTIWSKFPRVVRDLSKQLGKSVRLQMEGQGTDLDKTLLEAIKDPLTHLVRNAVDHGIELPEKRAARGKSTEGVLLLRAFHESGQVNIEIIDDGGGIDPAVIKKKAVAQGVVSQEEASRMSDRQALSLIFHPGLSTAEAVTNVSGRGVGMDVVRTNIEKIGGNVEVMSELGQGSTIRIKIPLTLAIIPALIVTTTGDRYAIPQVSLVELVRLVGEDAVAGIEDLHGTPVYRLRGDLLPLVFLDQALETREPRENTEDPVRNIVVVRADDRFFGLVVDEVNDTEEIVVKPLGQQTKSVPVYAGTAILGDGRVALILDVMGLAVRSGVIADERHDRVLDVPSTTENDPQSETYLLLRVDGARRMAIELTAVDRLEEFPESMIERTLDHEVVQHRGEIMPLVRVSNALGLAGSAEDAAAPDTGMLQVVVHSEGGRRVGLVVDAITDIVETEESMTRPSKGEGVRSAVVIDGKVTDVLDLEVLVADMLPNESGPDAHRASVEDAHVRTSTTRQFCTFYLEDLFLGVDVMQVQEVLRHQDMTRVPLTADVVSGLINLRGQTVTALDMRRRFGLAPRFEGGGEIDEEEKPMNLVLRTREGIVSILVDRIGDVLTVEDSTRERVPDTVQGGIRTLLTGVYKLPGKLLLVLDIEELVAVETPSLVA